jgi:hypothetical protein
MALSAVYAIFLSVARSCSCTGILQTTSMETERKNGCDMAVILLAKM